MTNEFGSDLQKLRSKYGISLTALSEMTKINRRTLQRWESCSSRPKNNEKRMSLAAGLAPWTGIDAASELTGVKPEAIRSNKTTHVIVITFGSGVAHVYPDNITTFHYAIANHDQIENIKRLQYFTGGHHGQR